MRSAVECFGFPASWPVVHLRGFAEPRHPAGIRGRFSRGICAGCARKAGGRPSINDADLQVF
jgi:hypothetical protein